MVLAGVASFPYSGTIPTKSVVEEWLVAFGRRLGRQSSDVRGTIIFVGHGSPGERWECADGQLLSFKTVLAHASLARVASRLTVVRHTCFAAKSETTLPYSAPGSSVGSLLDRAWSSHPSAEEIASAHDTATSFGHGLLGAPLDEAFAAPDSVGNSVVYLNASEARQFAQPQPILSRVMRAAAGGTNDAVAGFVNGGGLEALGFKSTASMDVPPSRRHELFLA